MKWLIGSTLVLVALAVGAPSLSEPNHKLKVRNWSITESKVYAKVKIQEWSDSQSRCLDQLWTLESHWNPLARNSTKVGGRHAGGIPQILGMSTKTLPVDQIDRGLSYIYWRYGTPCKALQHEKRRGWY